MAKNDPNMLQVILDELRDHRNESREFRAQTRLDIQVVTKDVLEVSKIAGDAHKRIDKYENRFWGMIIGAGGIGGGAGFGIGALLKKMGLY